jgi:hypothetical protein
MEILLLWLYGFFFLYSGGHGFTLVFKLYGDMNLLEVNA